MSKSEAKVVQKATAKAAPGVKAQPKAERGAERKKPGGRRMLESAVRSALCSASAPLAMKTDEKTGIVAVSRNVAGTRDLLHAALGKNAFRTRFSALSSDTAGSSGTAILAAIQANMATANEWATFAALFDEVRCVSAECTVWIVQSAGTLGATTNTLAILVWDSDDVTAPASLTALLNYTRQSGPVSIAITSTGALLPVAAHKEQGLQVTTGKMSTNGFPDESSGTVLPYPVRGEWVSTAASTAIIGSFKLAIEAQSGATFTYRSLIRYHVEYRMRQ